MESGGKAKVKKGVGNGRAEGDKGKRKGKRIGERRVCPACIIV